MLDDVTKLQVSPMSQIAPAGEGAPAGAWRAYGGDPSFECTWAGDGVLQGGWYRIEAEFDVYRGAIHAPALYPDYQRGHVLEEEAIRLPLHHGRTGAHRLSALVRLPFDVSRIRFDPSVLPCEFSMEGPRLTRLGKFAAAREMLAGAWNSRRGVARLRLLVDTAANLLKGGAPRMAEGLYDAYRDHEVAQQMSDYAIWLDFYDDTSPDALALAAESMAALTDTPVVSVVMPTYNTPERWLRAAIESVRAQVYPHWELCIADDASTDPSVVRVLEEYAASDARIRFVVRPENGHISHASNSALGLATGRYVALLDHDDALHPLALLECVRAFGDQLRWRMLFTDEDKVDEAGNRSDPYFKSDWNPDLFLSQNCVCHLGVYERALVEEVGGFEPGCEGAQDWDLTLRITERLASDQIGHVPRVLYHWRMIEGSTALAPGEKNYAHDAAMRVIQSHLDRTGQAARLVELDGYSGYYRIVRAVPEPAPLVSILIPTRDRADLLEMCIGSILERTDYPDYEILILDNGSVERKTHDYFASLADEPRVRVLRYDAPFNYSAINNFGARHARGSVLALLNNDIEVITRDWLAEMVGHAVRPEVGVVGAMLYYPNDTIQHAGVILGIGGVAGHCYVGHWRNYAGDKHRAGLTQNLSAVTAACAVVRAEVYAEVGGLDEALVVAFNDVDLCLRVRNAGYRNVWTPFAELYHHESASRGYENTPEKIARFKGEERFMQARWGRELQQDPYYNPNFAIDMAPFTLAYPPRSWNASPGPRQAA